MVSGPLGTPPPPWWWMTSREDLLGLLQKERMGFLTSGLRSDICLARPVETVVRVPFSGLWRK